MQKIFYSNDKGQLAQLIGHVEEITFTAFSGTSRSAARIEQQRFAGVLAGVTLAERMESLSAKIEAKGWRRQES